MATCFKTPAAVFAILLWSLAAPSEAAWPVVKVKTAESGVYFLSATSLASVMGVDTGEVITLITNGAVCVSNRGARCDYLPAASGLYFYGERYENLYTSNNVYWLSWTGGATPS